jgi:ribosomal protein S9
MNPNFESDLAAFGLVGVDDRRNEAKKLGLYTARVRPPYVRRWFTSHNIFILVKTA